MYIVRIGCEKPSETNARLQSITSSLFPKGARTIVPKDAPQGTFVRIIHCIGMSRTDFAFKVRTSI